MRKLPLVCVLALAASLLPACATKTGTGTATGAVIGAGAGYLIGKNNGSGAGGAAIGAAIGAGAGYIVGDQMDDADKEKAPTGPEPVVK